MVLRIVWGCRIVVFGAFEVVRGESCWGFFGVSCIVSLVVIGGSRDLKVSWKPE